MGDPSNDDTSAEDLQTWVARDDALRARAHRLAVELGRDEEGIYRTLNVRIADAARASGGICAYAAVVAMARKAPRCPPIAGSAQALRPHEA